MNYCSIQDAWGSQFNEINSNIEETDVESSNDDDTNYEDSYVGGTNQVVPSNSYRNKLKELKEKEDKLELYKKKLVKIQQTQKPQEKPKKIQKAQKTQKKQHAKKIFLEGGGIGNLSEDHSILLGLLLLFIIDYFGNLSY